MDTITGTGYDGYRLQYRWDSVVWFKQMGEYGVGYVLSVGWY